MDDQIIELNNQIKKELKEYNYNPFHLNSVFNYGDYTTVSGAIKAQIKTMNKIEQYCDLQNYHDFINVIKKIDDLNYLDLDPLINIENSDKPKLLTVDQLITIMDQLNDIKKLYTLK